MAMLIAWQTINAVRHPNMRRFTRGFLVVTPGLTIRDRLRVLQPNDPDSYYQSRELVPRDMLGDLNRANIVITNYHAFMRRETQDISKGGRAHGTNSPLSAAMMSRKFSSNYGSNRPDRDGSTSAIQPDASPRPRTSKRSKLAQRATVDPLGAYFRLTSLGTQVDEPWRRNCSSILRRSCRSSSGVYELGHISRQSDRT